MQDFTLTVKTTPDIPTEEIQWSTTASGTKMMLTGKGRTATVQAWSDCVADVTVKCGKCTFTGQVIVNTNSKLTTALHMNQSNLVFNNNGATYAQNITVEKLPRTSTQETQWSVIEGDSSMIRIEPTTTGAKIIPLKTGTCKVQAQSGTFKDVCEVTNVQYEGTSLYTNPTFRIENYKAVLTQGTHTEKFDVSYEPNTGHPQYVESKAIVGDDGNTYYLALLKTGKSKFRVNGNVPDSGGWKNMMTAQSDMLYTFALNPFPKINNFNFNYTMANKNNSINRELFDFTLNCINTAFTALNITEDPLSKNTMTMGDYQDSWFGEHEYLSDRFVIRMNEPALTRSYGSYAQYPYRWRATSVHEIGHSLGIKDKPNFSPSLYKYGADPDKRWFMQPNDLDVIKYYYRYLWNVDITLTQDEISRQVASMPAMLSEVPSDYREICFDFGTYTSEELLNVSDAIVVGSLEFDRVTDINIGNDLTLTYNVYRIVVDSIEKGTLTNTELKIPQSIDTKIDANVKYRMYLAQYANCPCSLVNIDQGLVNI